MRTGSEPEQMAHLPGQAPSVAEILGPAGSGKTTLLRELTRRWHRVVANINVRRSQSLPILIRNVTTRWPGLLWQYRRGRWFTWSEIRSMIYLEAWHQHLGHQHLGHQHLADDHVTVFDHGPLFRLASLRAFGPALTRSAVYTRWQDEMLRRWTSNLDIVFYLDAPNDVLCKRIDARDSEHRIKRRPATEMHAFLQRYRMSFEEVVRPAAATGRLKVLRFNTESEPTDQLADLILAALGFPTEEG